MSDRDSRGDPEARRIAQRNAQILSEAGRLASALRVLVGRTGLSEELDVSDIERRIAELERKQLMRANGHIEGRRRFRRPRHDSRNLGNPIRQNRPTNLLFLDESGTAHPAVKPGSGDFFALAAIAMSEEEGATYVSVMDDFKRQVFGRTDVTLHEPDIRRGDGIFSFENSHRSQERFRQQLSELLTSLDFNVFAVGVRKRAFEEEFLRASVDPYLPHDVYALALHLLLERYADFLAHGPINSRGRLTLEAQGPKEDAEHQRAYVETLLDGTQWVSGSDFQKYLETGLRFEPKSGSRPTELADMVARDFFEWIRSDCQERSSTWDIWESKVYRRGDLKMGKFGLKVFPDSDIREQIEKHRDQFRESD